MPSGADRVDEAASGGTRHHHNCRTNVEPRLRSCPIVSKLSPNSGPAGGGTAVTITDSNLAAATSVSFGSTAAQIDKTVSASEIEATSPKGSGTVDVTVTTAAGTSPKTAADHYTYAAR